MVNLNIRVILKQILNRHLEGNERVFIFGSRTGNKHRRFSDLDLGILADKQLSGMTMAKLETDLENSDLPFIVQVVDFSNVSQNFKQKAMRNIIEI